MSLLDAVERLAQRKKTKTKERSDDNKYITKTKKVEIPLEGNEKKTVTKTVTRPTMLGGANDKKVVTRDVEYSSNEKPEPKPEAPALVKKEISPKTEMRKPMGEIKNSESLEKKSNAGNESTSEKPTTKERVELALKKKSYKYVPTGKAGEVKRVELP